jgi:hypothetical protein
MEANVVGDCAVVGLPWLCIVVNSDSRISVQWLCFHKRIACTGERMHTLCCLVVTLAWSTACLNKETERLAGCLLGSYSEPVTRLRQYGGSCC